MRAKFHELFALIFYARLEVEQQRRIGLRRTLSVAIFIHSSKLASRGMTRFMGVTAVPATSGMSTSCEGVCGLFWAAARDMRRRFGVAELRKELLRCSWRACLRSAFSCRSSFKGTLDHVSGRSRRVWRVSLRIWMDGWMNGWAAHLTGAFCGVAVVLYLDTRGIVYVGSTLLKAVAVAVAVMVICGDIGDVACGHGCRRLFVS